MTKREIRYSELVNNRMLANRAICQIQRCNFDEAIAALEALSEDLRVRFCNEFTEEQANRIFDKLGY